LPAQCDPVVPEEVFQYRFGVSDVIASTDDLLELLGRPTPIVISAEPAPKDDPASIIAIAETHALYPVEPWQMVEVLRDDEVLPDVIPDLTLSETICWNGPDMMRQRQRTEINVLFLTFATEYLIEVHHVLGGPVEYGSYWAMYESLDGNLARQLGSWYFRKVTIDGRDYTYVRHFTLNGLTYRVPGLRFMVERGAAGHVADMMDSVYREAVNRHGTTPVESP